MTSNLVLMYFLNLFKLSSENDLLVILMTMEMGSVLVYFCILDMNPEFSLSSLTVSILTVMISESVLSLGLFISLARRTSKASVMSHLPSRC